LALFIDQTQKQSWIIKAGFQATFCEAGLPESDPCRHEPKKGGDGGKGFRKSFDCQFHARFPACTSPRSPNGGDDPRQQGNAEDEKDGLDHFVVETRFCHAPSLVAVEQQY
jgi:hypothetical protein